MLIAMLREMHQLNKQQWMNCCRLDSVILSKLRRQIARAWKFSPFYRDLFQSAGFIPENLQNLSDLQKLPIITKTAIQEAGESLFCRDIDLSKCVWLKTSGSSGSPTNLPFTRYDKSHRVLKELQALIANGYKITDRMLILVEPRCVVDKKALMQKLGLFRRDYLSIFEEESIQLEAIKKLRPAVIYGYTSSLRILAEKLISNNLEPPFPKILMSSAELMDPATRQLLTEAFGTVPVDFYGSMEFGWIAWQCPQKNGYHINSDCLIVECLKDDGQPVEPGEEGELVITNLHSDAAPLIRYATGDSAIFASKSCSCGRSLPLLSSINGRLADCIVLPDGRKLSPYVITCTVEEIPGVRQFQVIQETDGSIRIRLLSSRLSANPNHVKAVVEEQLDKQVRVTVEVLPELLRESNGKYKVVVSRIGADKIRTTSTDKELIS